MIDLRSTLSAFWYLVRFPGPPAVRMAAVLAILLCVLYSIGLGGLVLSAASFFGSEWSLDALSMPVRVGLGIAWVSFFTLFFMNLFLSGLLRSEDRSLLRRLRSNPNDAEVSAAVDSWLKNAADRVNAG